MEILLNIILFVGAIVYIFIFTYTIVLFTKGKKYLSNRLKKLFLWFVIFYIIGGIFAGAYGFLTRYDLEKNITQKTINNEKVELNHSIVINIRDSALSLGNIFLIIFVFSYFKELIEKNKET